MGLLNFDLEIEDIDIDLFMDVVREPMRAAAEKGMQVFLKQGIYAVISKWKHDPGFSVEVSQDSDSVTAEAYTGDKKYVWVDQGTTPISFSVVKPHMMKFPFQGRGVSYSAKTDGGSGDRLGTPINARTVNNRSIAARDISGKAIDNYLDGGEVVWLAVEQALGG